jgi:hypothetical protein
MAADPSADQVLRWTFVLTMIGVVLFFAASAMFFV